MTNVEEDMNVNKAKIMSAIIIENKKINYKDLKQNKKYKIDDFTDEYVLLIEEAVVKALKGFKIMEKCGYPVNEKQGMAILKLMFKLRGLEKEWEIYHKIKNGGI